MKILVTGGCGFIGSAFIRLVLKERPGWKVLNMDCLTYAGNPDNLKDVAGSPWYEFIYRSISEQKWVDQHLRADVDSVVNFAAESHVDRSLEGPHEFVRTNINGTLNLLEAARKCGVRRFLQVSTDEVYGELPPEGIFTEETPVRPRNPYSATKAAADHLVMAYANSFGMDVVITRSSNNYGPRQYPEKFIPLFVTNAMQDKKLPVYGDGMQIRDWLHVEDNCRGILAALEHGETGNVYNLGGGNERPNLEVAKKILAFLGKPESLLTHVKDRPGHDRHYALSSSKAIRELRWTRLVEFDKGLLETVKWYQQNYVYSA